MAETKNNFNKEAEVFKTLDKLRIKYRRFEHPPVSTLEEASRYWEKGGGAHCKYLFVRNNRGTHHYLIIVHGGKKVDLKWLASWLGEDCLSLASPERLKCLLGLTPGAVSPFGLIHDHNKEVRVVVDKDLLTEVELNFHPNVNTATLAISKEDFLRFLEWSGQKIIYLEMKKTHQST